MALEDVAEKTGDDQIRILAATLNAATTQYLNNNKSPSRKVHELDNRGSHFYLALYWAQALVEQSDNTELQDRFQDVARQLAENESKIVEELIAAQGQPVDVGGYYHPDHDRVEQAMRPSQTLNAILAAAANQPN